MNLNMSVRSARILVFALPRIFAKFSRNEYAASVAADEAARPLERGGGGRGERAQWSARDGETGSGGEFEKSRRRLWELRLRPMHERRVARGSVLTQREVLRAAARKARWRRLF
jgi:hypothetical protein